MKLKKTVDDLDYTAEANVNIDRKVSHAFYILRKDKIDLSSIEIKFKNSLQNKFVKLFESLKLSDNAIKNSTDENYKFLASSKNLIDSEKYLKEVMMNMEEHFLMKIYRSLLDDKEKLECLGAPIKIVYSKRFKQELKDICIVRIEGNLPLKFFNVNF